jgi:hypothetical protein
MAVADDDHLPEPIGPHDAVQLCGVPWGVCPDHGNTLSSSAGKTRCRTTGCGRTWEYDRGREPCAEVVHAVVVDANGTRRAMCKGHVLDAHEHGRLIGCTIEPLP